MSKRTISKKVREKHLIYQMYPLVDGTFTNMTELVRQYIHKLAPDYIWLSPVFKSPRVDGGYDVSDYYQIDERFGSMADFDNFVKTCAKYNIGVMLDLPVNHTSTEHEWFKASADGRWTSGKIPRKNDKDRQYSDYYLWMPLPNNWHSLFGGSACEFNTERREYYLHLFDKTQADLNWQNPHLIHEFQEIIKFWTEKHDVAGFRIDMCNILIKKSLENSWEPVFRGGSKYFQQKENLEVLHKLFGGKQFFTMGEVAGGELLTKGMLHGLTSNSLDAVYNAAQMDAFDTFLSNKNKAPRKWYKRWIKYFLKWASEPTHVVMLENHDSPRAVSRFQADPSALAILQFATPSNTACIYQGQEIGTTNPRLPNQVRDFKDIESWSRFEELCGKKGMLWSEAEKIVRYFSRDNARRPVNWSEWERQDRVRSKRWITQMSWDDANPAIKRPTQSDIQSMDTPLQVYEKIIDIWRTHPALQNPDGKVHVRDIKFKKRGREVSYRVGDLEVKVDLTGESSSYVREGNVTLLETGWHRENI